MTALFWAGLYCVSSRRIPPLLWTRVRSDLPGYLADSEADGVCVINWYHKQFKMAAKARYFVSNDEYLYFHSYMADYFLGTYGGGIVKPFRYTEVQKHMFRLKSKVCSTDIDVREITRHTMNLSVCAIDIRNV